MHHLWMVCHPAAADSYTRCLAGKVTVIPVQFSVQYECKYGQEVYLVGSCAALGAWDTTQAVKLTWNEGHTWKTAVGFTAG